MFIYCFTEQDSEELKNKDLKFIRKENIGNKIAYVFLYNSKLNFELDEKRFVFTNKMTF